MRQYLLPDKGRFLTAKKLMTRACSPQVAPGWHRSVAQGNTAPLGELRGGENVVVAQQGPISIASALSSAARAAPPVAGCAYAADVCTVFVASSHSSAMEPAGADPALRR
eukprot:COSAG02_NODE_3205_length_7171_cov_18.044118_4_plen_110_part_00